MTVTGVREVIASYRPSSLSEEVAAFARDVTTAAGPTSASRAKAFLFAAGKIGAFAFTAGLSLCAEVCLSEAVIERFVATQ